MRILLVEDEKKVPSFIKKGLEEEGYAVDSASDGEAGLEMGLDGVHDLIILDINLPKRDGLSVLKKLRMKRISTPVLLLTVRTGVEDRVIGLDTGADDYLTKPFAFEELLAVTFLILGGGTYGLLAYSLSRDMDAALNGVAEAMAQRIHLFFLRIPMPADQEADRQPL